MSTESDLTLDGIIDSHSAIEATGDYVTTVRSTMTKDCYQHHQTLGLRAVGASAVIEYYRALFGAVPDLRMEHQSRSYGDDKVFLEGCLAGTFDNAWLGIEPTHNRFNLWCVVRIEVRDRRLVGETLYYDPISLCDQAGIDFFHLRTAASSETARLASIAN